MIFSQFVFMFYFEVHGLISAEYGVLSLWEILSSKWWLLFLSYLGWVLQEEGTGLTRENWWSGYCVKSRVCRRMTSRPDCPLDWMDKWVQEFWGRNWAQSHCTVTIPTRHTNRYRCVFSLFSPPLPRIHSSSSISLQKRVGLWDMPTKHDIIG